MGKIPLYPDSGIRGDFQLISGRKCRAVASPHTPYSYSRPQDPVCENRIGTVPPRASADVIYVDFPKGDPASWGINPSVLSSSLLLLSLDLSDTPVYEPYIRVLFGTAAFLCEVAVLKWRMPHPFTWRPCWCDNASLDSLPQVNWLILGTELPHRVDGPAMLAGI